MRILALVALLACGSEKTKPSPEELIKTHGPAIEPKLPMFEKIAKATLPPVEADATAPITVPGPPLEEVYIPDTSTNKVTGNMAVAFVEDFASWDKVPANPVRDYVSDGLVNDCWMVMRKKLFAGHAAGYPPTPQWNGWAHITERVMPMCAALHYLIVIKLQAVKDTDYIDGKTFGAGGAIAEAHIFDVTTGNHLGAVMFDAVSSQSTHDASSDLKNNFRNAFKSAITKRVPGAKFR